MASLMTVKNGEEIVALAVGEKTYVRRMLGVAPTEENPLTYTKNSVSVEPDGVLVRTKDHDEQFYVSHTDIITDSDGNFYGAILTD